MHPGCGLLTKKGFVNWMLALEIVEHGCGLLTKKGFVNSAKR